MVKIYDLKQYQQDQPPFKTVDTEERGKLLFYTGVRYERMADLPAQEVSKPKARRFSTCRFGGSVTLMLG